MNVGVAGVSPLSNGLRDAVWYCLVKGRLGLECPFHHSSFNGPEGSLVCELGLSTAQPCLGRAANGRQKGH